MKKSTPETEMSVADRLVNGALALVEEGETRPSVRRIVERSGRSTMCVYTYFGGRDRLLEEAHRRASAGLLESMAGAEGVDAKAEVAQDWILANAPTADWMFSLDAPEAGRVELIQQCRQALDDVDAERVALMLGRLVLSR